MQSAIPIHFQSVFTTYCRLFSFFPTLCRVSIRASFVFKNVLLCKIVNQRMKKFFGFHTLLLESLDNEKDALLAERAELRRSFDQWYGSLISRRLPAKTLSFILWCHLLSLRATVVLQLPFTTLHKLFLIVITLARNAWYFRTILDTESSYSPRGSLAHIMEFCKSREKIEGSGATVVLFLSHVDQGNNAAGRLFLE